MTLDERLERLTERHEALTQTVELMAAENRDRDKRLEERDKRLEGLLTQMAEGITRLLHVAEIHEQPLDRHEDRLDNLH